MFTKITKEELISEINHIKMAVSMMKGSIKPSPLNSHLSASAINQIESLERMLASMN